MKISLFLLAILVVLPLVVYGQQTDNADNQPENGNGKDDLDPKNEDATGDNENKEAKPRKTTFKEERFEKLFNNRHRNKPRLLTPKYHQKPKAKLPAYIKNPPSIKPLGQDGLPVDEAPRATTPTPRAKQSQTRATAKTTTTTPSSRNRARITSTTTQRPSLSDSERNRRFNSPPKARTETGANLSSRIRGRLNQANSS